MKKHSDDPRTETFRLAQISDLHLVAPGQLLRKTIDSRTKAEQAFTKALSLNPDALLITGDLAQRKNDIYDDVRAWFGQLSAESGISLIAIGGNHDPVDSVDASFSTPRLAHGPRVGNGVYTLGQHDQLRIITVDTGGVGARHGHLEHEQLDWLAEVLQTSAPAGTVLVMHHAPIDSLIQAQRGSGLDNPEALAQVVTGTDVRVILSGHYHHPVAGELAGIPVWAAPAVGYNFNPGAPANELHGTDTAWISQISLQPKSVLITPIQVIEPVPVFRKKLT